MFLKRCLDSSPPFPHSFPVKSACFNWGSRQRQTAWGSLVLLLALSVSASARSHDVDFTLLLPDAERVHLLGSFNNWVLSDDSLMSNDGGLWTKTLPLEEGQHEYFFRIEGSASARDTTSDWKSPRLKKTEDGAYHSVLRIPDDLEAYRARLRQGSSTPDGIEVPLAYLAFPEEDAAYCPGGYGRQTLSASPPPGDWTLPEFGDKHPLYAVIELGDSRFLAVLDRKPANALFYNRLYFDRNGNGDLTDEEPLVTTEEQDASRSYHSCSFPSVDVRMETAGQVFPRRLAWYLSGSVPPNPVDSDSRAEAMRLRTINLFTKSACAYMGEFQLDGKAYRLALGDTTANGSFDEKVALSDNRRDPNGRLYPGGDSFLITPNNYFSGRNILLLGDFLAAGERLFQVHLDVPAGRLRLEPKEAGRVELPGPMQSLSLISAKDQGFMAVDTGRQVPVPPDDWSLLSYALEKKDAWGDTWLLESAGCAGSPPLRVLPQGRAILDVGEPLKSQVQLPEYALAQAAAQGSLRMSFLLRGKQDEFVTNLQRISGTRSQHETATRYTNRPKEPAYRIIQPNGEQVASGSFEYG